MNIDDLELVYFNPRQL